MTLQAHTATKKTLTVLSAAPADLSEAYKDNSCSPSTYIDMNNDNNGLGETKVSDSQVIKVHGSALAL